jgi:toxin YoeB
MTNLVWTPRAWEDYLYWQGRDKAKLKRLNSLINTALRTPLAGEGRPEPLKYQLSGLWSRRLDQEHRLVYAWDEEADTLTILQCRYHYEKR